MTHKMMQENLARLFQEVDYKSCGSEPELYELAQHGSHHKNPYTHFSKISSEFQPQQMKVDKSEGSLENEQKDMDQFVNPFNKKLFKQRRMRRSSVYSSAEWQQKMFESEQKNAINSNKSMVNLKASFQQVQPEQNWHYSKRSKEVTSRKTQPENEQHKKLLISAENYEHLKKHSSKAAKIEQIEGLFYEVINFMYKLREDTIQQINNQEQCNEASDNIFTKTKENLLYMKEYLAYQYENLAHEISSQSFKHHIQTLTHYSSTGDHDSYDEHFGGFPQSTSNHILELTNCQPPHEPLQEYYNEQNDQNNQNQGNMAQQNGYIYGFGMNKKQEKHVNSKKKVSSNTRGPKSIYESVLEDRRLRKNKRIHA